VKPLTARETSKQYIVIGGGLSGLASAYSLLEQAPDAHIEIWEASERTGGLIGTACMDGRVIDLGPESILSEKKVALELVHKLGIEHRVITTRKDRHGAYLVRAGKLVRIPRGFALVAPGDEAGLIQADVLSEEGLTRALQEPSIPPRARNIEAHEDESLASFARRRFGWELFERLSQPLAAGIYGADPELLGLSATMPRFPSHEATYGSVAKGLEETVKKDASQASSGARYGLFFSFDGGMQVLTDALTEALGDRIRYQREARAIVRREGHVEVTCQRGEVHRADGVILALPAYRTARLLESIDGTLAAQLTSVPYGSAATATFVWKRSDVPFPLDAYGFVVPRVERRRIFASTWSSEKWPGRTSPDEVLIRTFASGDDDFASRSDELLALEARRELRALMGITATPLFEKVIRYPRAMPHYTTEHLARRAAARERFDALGPIAIAGNALMGVGIPDAIQSGIDAAKRVTQASQAS
jgi:oxygen-dependent protoporphyrinogen oxidase